MSDLEKNLINEFQDAEYRYAYAKSFLNTKLATQIKTLREQRGKTQAEVGALMGIKQPGYRRFEDVNHDVWKTDSLWDIAQAHGVRLNISFETFGSLLEDKKHFRKEALQRPDFEHDPAFHGCADELQVLDIGDYKLRFIEDQQGGMPTPSSALAASGNNATPVVDPSHGPTARKNAASELYQMPSRNNCSQSVIGRG